MLARAAAQLVVCALGASPVAAAARDVALDVPLGVATESPLRQLFLDFTGADARAPEVPRIALRWVMSNSWTTPTTLSRGADGVFLQLDGQADALALSATVPWSAAWPRGADVPFAGAVVRRLTTTVEARATLWWGGWSDGVVESWHRFSGLANFEREDYDSGQVALTLRTRDATVFDLRAERLSLGGVVMRNQVALAQGGSSLRAAPEDGRARWAVSLRADVKLPLGSAGALGSSDRADAGAGLLATAELTRWLVVHANAFTSAWGGLPTHIPLQPRRFHYGGELSTVVVGRGWALLVEDRVVSPIFSSSWKRFGADGSYLQLQASAAFAATRWQNQISVGVRRGPVTAWFSEDFTFGGTEGTNQWFFNSNTPDISIGLEVAHAF